MDFTGRKALARRSRIAVRIVFLAVAALSAAGCGGGGGGGGNPASSNPAFSGLPAKVDSGSVTPLAASGGMAPYSFSVVSGGGAIDATDSTFTAPTGPATVILRVADAKSATAQATIAVNAPLVATPAALTIGAGTTVTLAATGGEAPYTYSVLSGGGAVNAGSGAYVAPAAAGPVVVEIKDAFGAAVPVALTINPPLAMSPASITVTAGAGQAVQFSGVNGVPPYRYAQQSGIGSFDAGGRYAAGAASGVASVAVTDAQGTTVAAAVRVLRIRVNDIVNAAVSDGQSLYVGGNFTAANPLSAPRLLVADALSGDPVIGCDLQSGFLDGTVLALAASPTAIYVGGQFSHYRGAVVGNLVKIDASSCALDTTFSRAVGVGMPGESVNALTLSGAALYVGGNFNSYRGATVSSVIKIDAASGVLDPAFAQAAGPAGQVHALAISGATLYAGGFFQTYGGSSAPYLAKVDAASGAVDASFGAGAQLNGPVSALAAGAGALYVGGTFTAYGGTAADLAKLDATTGALDATFTGAALGYTNVGALVAGGNALYVGREFATGGAPVVAKLDLVTGATDATFTHPGALDFGVSAMQLAGGSLYIGGAFRHYGGAPAVRLAKLDAVSGALDTAFGQTIGVNNSVAALALSGTSLIAGGTFSTYRGTPVGHLAKFDAGTDALDQNFAALGGADSPVLALALAGPSLYVGGGFTAINGGNSPGVAKLDAASGAVDAVFAQGTGVSVASAGAVLLPFGGALYVGGNFATYQNSTAGSMAKVDPVTGIGDIDFMIYASATGPVNAIAASGSSLYVGGQFTNFDQFLAHNLAKADPVTGAFDVNFEYPQGAGAASEAVQALWPAASSLYVGGSFTSYRGVAADGLVKVDPTTGVADAAFAPPATQVGSRIAAIAGSASALYVGGEFSAYRGTPAQNLAKIDPATGALDTVFTQPSGVCDAGLNTLQCGGIISVLLLQNARLYVGAYAATLYRGSPAYFFYPVDAASGALIDP